MQNKLYRGMLKDVAVILLGILLLTGVFVRLDAFELLADSLKQYESWQLDELMMAIVVAPPFLLWLALRRWHDACFYYQQRIDQENKLLNRLRFDSLTGLPNNSYFESLLAEEISQSFTNNRPIALAVINIDRFHNLHQRYTSRGVHNLIAEIASRIQCAVRAGDIVARIAEDEFCVIFIDLAPEQLEDVAREFTRKVNIIPGDEVCDISCSVGLTCFTPLDLKLSASNLLRQATSALYAGRRISQEKYHLYNKEQEYRKLQQQEWRKQLSKAIDNEELVLYLQPQVDIRTGLVSGAEALVRWQHPQQGLLTPDRFISLIEEHPLSIRFGEWVIQSALQKLAQLDDSSLSISINITPYHLMHEAFCQRLEQMLQRYPAVAPGRLKLEVTESDRILDVGQAAKVMRACQALGLSFSLDDFGTGYSALNQLRQLPFSQLKIDRSFVCNFLNDGNDFNMVHAIILLAHSFDLEVVAEGVEREAQLNALSELGCDIVQGYYYARPLSAKDFGCWLIAQRMAAETTLVKVGEKI